MFYFKETTTDGDDFIRITILQGAYDCETLNNEIKRIIIDEAHFTESGYSFQIKPIFSTLGSVLEISPQGPIISYVFDDSIGNILGFNRSILYKKYNLSPNPVDILPFDVIFLECDNAKEMIYKQKRSGIIDKWTMTFNPG